MTIRCPKALLLTALLVFCCGCVVRTTRRGPTLSELAGGVRVDENGQIVETKTIWIWQR